MTTDNVISFSCRRTKAAKSGKRYKCVKCGRYFEGPDAQAEFNRHECKATETWDPEGPVIEDRTVYIPEGALLKPRPRDK